ncbi:MAG: hypothetical protein Q9215_004487 [Flavoplaca cf. flavocitrina]
MDRIVPLGQRLSGSKAQHYPRTHEVVVLDGDISPGPLERVESDVIDDAMDDAMDDAEFEEWLKTQNRAPPRIGRYAAYQSASISSTSNRPTRNLSIIHPFRTIASYKHNEILLRPGVCVELRDKTLEGRTEAAEDEDEPHNDFIRIVDIIQDIRSQAVTIRGWIFQRASYLNGVIKKDRNEVCWIMHIDEDDSRDAKTQAMETVSVEDITRRRRLILTNQPFPKLSFREDHSCLLESKEVIRNERILVCRYKYICFYISAYRRDANTWSERILERLRGTECDKSSAADDKELRRIWRGETVSGGAYLRSEPNRSSNIIDLTNGAMEQAPGVSMSSLKKSRVTESTKREDGPSNDSKGDMINGFRSAKRPYSSVGVPAAQSKRHRISHSQSRYERPPRTISLLEEMRKKCSVKGTTMPEKQQAPKTSSKRQYTFNDYFCGAGGMSRAAYQNKLHIQDAFDFDQHACSSYQMNFPDARIHCLWAHEFVNLPNECKCDIAHVSPVCKFFSPAHTRVGKDDEMNTASWTAIGELLMKSRPRVVTLEQTFGLVLRARHRGYLNALIQVFTSHGYSIRWRLLHCADYGLPQMRLRTFMIASCALATIPPSAPDHNIHHCTARTAPPKSGDQLARTITCGGGGQVHPSGTRDYTIREFATLNGFGPEHVFAGTGAKKQIGNAVPPVVGAKVLGSVVEALEKEDRISRG